MKKSFISIFLLLSSTGVAYADWTGDKEEGMVSEVVINKLHSGQFNNSAYFCVEGVKSDGYTIRACQLSNDSYWSTSFDLMYNQSMYFYSTGQLVRIYYKPNVWNNPDFMKSLTSNVLIGYSTCVPGSCFGPDRKKP
ncbi:subtilase family AB5 toxin binding subunit [Escherichia coli]|uniref:subtilase family AB5 toxin binding subunit n=1 Tax=Escherichia coli TaxID=562 RepID=UPI0039C2E5E4